MSLLTGCQRRTILKYTLLQLPGTGLLVLALLILEFWIDLQPVWFWGIIALWILKEIILFPLTWRSYQGGNEEAGEALIGATGQVVTTLEPEGTIDVGGEFWSAICKETASPLQAGTPVRVIARTGLVLQVVLATDAGAPPEHHP